MRTTITLNDKVFRALKLRAVETDKNVSHLIEEAVSISDKYLCGVPLLAAA